MSYYPPPGGLPPGGPPPGAGQPAPGPYAPQQPPYAPPPGFSGSAHKPGAIPLRPLTLGDMYDAAFRIIRFNPRATVGAAVLVAAVAMALPVLVTGLLTATMDVSLSTDGDLRGAELAGVVGAIGSLGLGTVLQSLGLVLVGGMIAHVVAAAAVGRRLSLGEAWAATRGQRWRLVGLTALLGLSLALLLSLYIGSWIAVAAVADGWQGPVLYALVSVPAFLAFLVWFWIRVYYLPVPALMLERIGVFAALRRGYRLTRGAFWRTFGIALLTMVIVQVAGSMLAMPLSFVGQGALMSGASSEVSVVLVVISQALASVVSAAFVTPFSTAVSSLQYVDQRMRTEAFDVELMERAGITRS